MRSALCQVSGVDIYVGGHSHSLLLPEGDAGFEDAEGPYPTLVEDAEGIQRYVVTAKCYTLYAGSLKVSRRLPLATHVLELLPLNVTIGSEA